MSKQKTSEKKMNGRIFDALPAAEKERIFQEIEQSTPEQRMAESRPMDAADRKRWARIGKKMGRPKIGKGAKIVSLSIEAGLLKRVDAYAKKNGLKRSELFIQGVRSILPDAAKVTV